MAIYGEYLFLENFATGIMILFFTGKILGVRTGSLQCLFCGSCCGAYAFAIFLPIGGILSWACKIVFSLLMVWIAFGAKTREKLLQSAAVFLGITILYGGIAIALLTSFSRTGVTAAAGVYLTPQTYLSVTVAAILAALFLWFLLKILKERRLEARRYIETEVRVESSAWKLWGLIDSGNDLREPLTGRPVCIVDRHLGEKMLQEAGLSATAETRFTVIPYRSVGTKHGVLEGFRADEICFEDGTIVKRPIIALCEEDHFQGSIGTLQILLPASLLERGIYGDC